MRQEAADWALMQELTCDPAEHPLAQPAVAIRTGDQEVDLLRANDVEQLVGHVRCLQHKRGTRHDAMTGQIIHDIADAVLAVFNLGLLANLHEEQLFGIMQERQ